MLKRDEFIFLNYAFRVVIIFIYLVLEVNKTFFAGTTLGLHDRSAM